MELDKYSLRLRLVVRICAFFSRIPDMVLANSEVGMNAHLALGYRPRLMEIVDNGIDIERFRPDAIARLDLRNELGIAHDAIVVAHVARTDPMKDHETFLAAMKNLPDICALMIGTGTELIASPPNVRAIGLRSDIWRFYAAADFIVSSSAFGEGFSNSIAEGMASGLPAVATNVGAAGHIVGDTGIIVPPRDPGALAAAIRTLASEPVSQREQRSRRARQRIVEQFSRDRAAERFADIYNKLA